VASPHRDHRPPSSVRFQDEGDGEDEDDEDDEDDEEEDDEDEDEEGDEVDYDTESRSHRQSRSRSHRPDPRSRSHSSHSGHSSRSRSSSIQSDSARSSRSGTHRSPDRPSRSEGRSRTESGRHGSSRSSSGREDTTTDFATHRPRAESVDMMNTSSASPISTPPPSYMGVAPGLPSMPTTATTSTPASTLPVATSISPTESIRPSLRGRFGMDASSTRAAPWDLGRPSIVDRRSAISSRSSQPEPATSHAPWSQHTANPDIAHM
jgi:hypothetical protein